LGVLIILRLAALTVLLSGLVACSQAPAQEAPFAERTASQNLDAVVAQIEMQVQLSKLKRLFEKIAEHELEAATMVFADQEDAERKSPILSQKEKLIEKLKTEATTTREQLGKLVAKLPQGSTVQPSISFNQPLNPAETQKHLIPRPPLHGYGDIPETARMSVVVKTEFINARVIFGLIRGVLREEDRQSLAFDESNKLIVLKGQKHWVESARKLIEALDKAGSPTAKAAESP
jgi:hypothetical protein